MVPFKCNICKDRFPTFHPAHRPAFALESTKHCSIEVASWDTQPPEATRTMATFHTGTCQVCAANLQRVEQNADLRGKCTFGPENSWDPLNNIDDPRFPFGRDIGGLDVSALRRELQYCHEHATVTESMFVALEHMQVVCCYLRSARHGAASMAGFRKNIISFPQDLTELKQLQNFFSNLQVHDVVNVILPDDATQTVQRAVVCELTHTHIAVSLPDRRVRDVPLSCVRQRVSLPWQPRDIADHFLVFRRRRGREQEYVEDLRVRRAMIKRILFLLTREGEWREHQGVQPMHQYYRDFDWLTDAEIERVFPDEDGVPPGLVMQEYDPEEVDARESVDAAEFTDWLVEGRHDCRLAQHLLQYWVHHLRGTDQDTPADLFAALLCESRGAEVVGEGEETHALPLDFLAAFLIDTCKFSFTALEQELVDDARDEVGHMIAQEVHVTQAYVSTWRPSGTVAQAVDVDVAARLTHAVFPWQRIQEEPTVAMSDARFTKSFPVGDALRPRRLAPASSA